MLPVTATLPPKDAPPVGNETVPDPDKLVTSSTLILDAISRDPLQMFLLKNHNLYIP